MEMLALTMPAVKDASIARPPLAAARRYIDQIDFAMIVGKITKKDPNIARLWTLEQAEEAIGQYRNYLYLLRKYFDDDKQIPPSIEVDEIWHHHILDTRMYLRDCQSIFGEYLHHFPYFGMRGAADFRNLTDAFETTQSLYFAEYGVYLTQILDEQP
jgi:hypothetical protein